MQFIGIFLSGNAFDLNAIKMADAETAFLLNGWKDSVQCGEISPLTEKKVQRLYLAESGRALEVIIISGFSRTAWR